MANSHVFCFGLGYSAQAIARRLLDSGWTVSGTCRSEEKARALQETGFEIWLFDEYTPISDFSTALKGVTHVLSSVPPAGEGDPVLSAHGNDVARLADDLQWIGYLSTVGVYGDQQGGWVDEATPVNPGSASTVSRVRAEQGWLDLGEQMNVPAHVFRLPGIYGPGQRNQLAALKSGTARRIIKPGQVFNRIHVDDLASIVIASMERVGGSSIYNVADDEPAPAAEIVRYAAELLGMQPPPEEAYAEAKLSEFGRRFYEECKRVKNQRIKQELGITLRYPTYREGLRAISAGLE